MASLFPLPNDINTSEEFSIRSSLTLGCNYNRLHLVKPRPILFQLFSYSSHRWALVDTLECKPGHTINFSSSYYNSISRFSSLYVVVPKSPLSISTASDKSLTLPFSPGNFINFPSYRGSYN